MARCLMPAQWTPSSLCDRPWRVQNAMDGWEAFAGDMQQYYGLDLDCLRDEYYREQARVHRTSELGRSSTDLHLVRIPARLVAHVVTTLV